MITVLVIVASAAGLAVFWHRRRGEKGDKQARRELRKNEVNDFASVELRCARTACKTARNLAGQPILAVEAPVLPLANCDAAVCQCSYRKIDDRRQDAGRRTADHGIEPLIFDGAEQRAARIDRRTG